MKKWIFGKKAGAEAAEPVHLQGPRNEYYDGVSNIYHLLFIILLTALLVFVCVAMMCNIDLFTYENFYYLAKDISAASDLLTGSGNVINYEISARNQTFALYRGGLAVGGDSGLQLFTATGRETLNTSPDYTEPVLCGSERYLLMYDIGEKRYSVYNSFVCVHHEECEYPIFAGAMSDSGYYAVVTESYSHAGVVCLYNDRFELINRYNRTDMVVSAAINQAGNRLAFATAGMKNGAYLTTLVIAVPGQAETAVELEFEGVFPYSVEFIDRHRLLLTGDTVSYVISVDDGAEISSVKYDGAKQLAFSDANAVYVAYAFSVNPVTDTYRLIVTDVDGVLIMDHTFESGVSCLTVYGEYLFMMTDTGVARINPADMSHDFISCDTDGKTLLITDADEILVCGGQSAVYYEFDN